MPKQQLKIEQFHGGLNTDSDPRDIADNEFSALTGVALDKVGVIKLIGAPANATGTNLNGVVDYAAPSDFGSGKGLFAFNSDYDDGSALVSTNYLVAYSEAVGQVNIYDSAGAWNGGATNVLGYEFITDANDRTFADVSEANWVNTGSPNNLDTMGGDDGDFDIVATSDASNVKYCVLDGANFETGLIAGRKYRLSYDLTLSAFASGTLTVGFCNTSNSIHTSDFNYYRETQSVATETLDFYYEDTTDHAKMIIHAATSTAFTAIFDNFSLKDITTSTGADDAPISTSSADVNFYAPNGNLRICDGLYSNYDRVPTWYGIPIKAEYASTVAAAYGGSVNVGGTWQRYDASIESTTFDNTTSQTDGNIAVTIGPTANLVMHNNGADNFSGTGLMEDRNLTIFAGSDGGAVDISQANWGLGMVFQDVPYSDGSGTWQPSDDTYYKFYATFVYDGIQESHPKEFLMFSSQLDDDDDGLTKTGDEGLRFYNTANEDGNSDSNVATGIRVSFKPRIRMRHGDSQVDAYVFGAPSLTATNGGNERITGCRIYYSDSNEGHADLWIMMDVDFVKGVKAIGLSAGGTGYVPFSQEYASSPYLENFSPDAVQWIDPPKFDTYETINGYKHDSKLNAKWKTSVVANGRVYIGNIKRQKLSTFDGGGTWSTTRSDDPEYQDRICRSPVDRFDTFPEENDIELFGANDGDSIVKLEEFADRLFIFKKQSLQILNIANDANILEGSYPYLGLDDGERCQSVRTDHGIAWMNSNGVYFYDGNNIQPLSEGKIDDIWKGTDAIYSTAFWLTADVPTLGYDPSSKKLIISNNVDAASATETALLYDFKLKNWVYDLNPWTDDTIKTNFVVYRGELIWMEAGTDTPAENVAVKKWSDAPAAISSGNLNITTKDFDFGAPAVRKKVYKVYISYKGNGENVGISWGTNGLSTTSAFYKITSGTDGSTSGAVDGSNALRCIHYDAGTTDWLLAELKPSASINNVYSFQMKITAIGTIAADFEINDITIIYRMKNIK